MDKIDLRVEVLERARRSLREKNRLSRAESEELLQLINILIGHAQQNSSVITPDGGTRGKAPSPDSYAALLESLRQQADELDALKKLSLNLTSSLDLHTVLEAVVTEAMRLMKNASTAHIFLYANEKLEFGASLSQDGIRNVPTSMPRDDGLTYAVARSGQQIIVKDMSNHPLYADAPETWTGSIVGIPLKTNDHVV